MRRHMTFATEAAAGKIDVRYAAVWEDSDRGQPVSARCHKMKLRDQDYMLR